MKLVEKVMTKNYIGLLPGSSLIEAYRFMHLKGVRHLPVFDHLQKLVGILSERDLLRAFETNDKGELFLGPDKKVSSFMSTPVVEVSLQDTMTEVIYLMKRSNISALMVKDLNGNYVGILTTDDLINSFQSV